MSDVWLLIAVAAVLLAAAVLWRPKSAHLPPRAPIRGETYPWREWHALSKTYGSIFMAGDTVICNNMASAEFFLEKHARDTADRPRSIAGSDIFSHGKRTLLVGYSPRWRRLRRALHSVLQPSAARDLRPVQETAARDVVRDIVATPDDFQSHIQTYAATLVVHMAYGRGKARYSDPDIQKVIEGAERLGTLLRPGAFKVESHPWLQYVPGYLTTVRKWAADELRLFRSSLATAKEPSFATYLRAHQAELELDNDDIAYLCGSVFGAGSDTTASAIAIVVMAAAEYPAAQARVQAELDAIGLPTFDDLTAAETPVLHAFIAESFRWRPVSSGGFRHRTTADVAYGIYVVPKGTPVVGNHWAISRDAGYYGADVEDFNIDRWLKNGDFNSKLKHVQFGFGRRVCPGQHVAHNSVLINSALLLWGFNITRKVEDGRETPIDTLAFTNTANSHPLPFKASFTPRHDTDDLDM